MTLNGEQAARYRNTGANRGGTREPTFIGLQAYPGSRVAFRGIRLKAL